MEENKFEIAKIQVGGTLLPAFIDEKNPVFGWKLRSDQNGMLHKHTDSPLVLQKD